MIDLRLICTSIHILKRQQLIARNFTIRSIYDPIKGKMAVPNARTWADLKGIRFSFLPHSNQSYSHIHEFLNTSYAQALIGPAYDALFTTAANDTLKTGCATLLLDTIFSLIKSRAVNTQPPSHLDSIMPIMKANLPMTFMDPDGVRQYIPESCGEAIGLGQLSDLLNFTAKKY